MNALELVTLHPDIRTTGVHLQKFLTIYVFFISLLAQGKKAIRRQAATLGSRKSVDMRSRLEDMILGQGSNRQDLVQRASRKGK